MTLLLTCVTPSFVVQASDRRLTLLDGSVHEQIANKATLLCKHAAFAYTGLAQMGILEKTHELLLRSLAKEDISGFGALLEELRRNATQAVRNLPLRVPASMRTQVRRTSFVGAGFLQVEEPAVAGLAPSQDSLYPFIAVVSNAQNIAEEWADQASRDFVTSFKFMASTALFGLHVSGQTISDAERTGLRRNISECLRRGLSPNSVARHLTRAVRDVAARNSTVGANVMCTIVLRSEALSDLGNISGPAIPLVPELFNEAVFFRQLPDSQPMWLFCPASYSDRVHYIPNFACNGLQMTGGVFAPEDMHEAAVEELGPPPGRRRA